MRRVVKRLARARFELDLSFIHALRRSRVERPYVRGGECRRRARALTPEQRARLRQGLHLEE